LIELTAYENLLVQAADEGLNVKEKNIPGFGGRIRGNRIAIHQGLETEAEKADTLAEELGHHYKTVGDITDQSDPANRKQERIARAYAYDLRIGLDGLVRAFIAGCRQGYEIAEFLGVTEALLQESIEYWTDVYGTVPQQTEHGTIRFQPVLMVTVPGPTVEVPLLREAPAPAPVQPPAPAEMPRVYFSDKQVKRLRKDPVLRFFMRVRLEDLPENKAALRPKYEAKRWRYAVKCANRYKGWSVEEVQIAEEERIFAEYERKMLDPDY